MKAHRDKLPSNVATSLRRTFACCVLVRLLEVQLYSLKTGAGHAEMLLPPGWQLLCLGWLEIFNRTEASVKKMTATLLNVVEIWLIHAFYKTRIIGPAVTTLAVTLYILKIISCCWILTSLGGGTRSVVFLEVLKKEEKPRVTFRNSESSAQTAERHKNLPNVQRSHTVPEKFQTTGS